MEEKYNLLIWSDTQTLLNEFPDYHPEYLLELIYGLFKKDMNFSITKNNNELCYYGCGIKTIRLRDDCDFIKELKLIIPRDVTVVEDYKVVLRTKMNKYYKNNIKKKTS